MSGIEDELVVALTRLKALLEQPPPGDVLQKLVHRRRLMEVAGQTLLLRSRYFSAAAGGDPGKSKRIAELGAEVERLQTTWG